MENEEKRMMQSELYRYLDRQNAADGLPETVRLWLADKYKMCGIPFRYLVPDEKLLPPESIRFFYVDRDWVDAMAAGAFSIGRQTGPDAAVNEAAYPFLVSQAVSCLPRHRLMLMHENHIREELRQNGVVLSDSVGEDAVLSGFLLRSCLVRYWKGLEVNGYEGQEKRHILRMDALSTEILFCLFDGEIDRILIREPAEDLHFEAPDVCRGSADNRIRIRRITGAVGEYSGAEAALAVNDKGRADIRGFAQAVQGALGSGAGTVYSAELALQLLSSADSCEMKNEGKG